MTTADQVRVVAGKLADPRQGVAPAIGRSPVQPIAAVHALPRALSTYGDDRSP